MLDSLGAKEVNELTICSLLPLNIFRDRSGERLGALLQSNFTGRIEKYLQCVRYVAESRMAQVTKFRMIQLWTNGGGKEFALRLEDAEPGIFAAATHLGTDYPFMIEQFSCTEDAGCDWQDILQKHADKWTKGDAIRALIQTKESESNNHFKDPHNNIRNSSTSRIKRIKPILKCHFCFLMYFTDEERLEHEKMWHAAKLQAHAPAPAPHCYSRQ